jgi:hypothetical protein
MQSAYVGVYDSVTDAEAGYQLVKDLHTEGGLIDAYNAAIVERRDDGKTTIVKNHETPARAACSEAEWGWPVAWSWRSSHSQQSAADCCWARPPEARSSARSPVTRRRA